MLWMTATTKKHASMPQLGMMERFQARNKVNAEIAKGGDGAKRLPKDRQKRMLEKSSARILTQRLGLRCTKWC